jgi:hypothetical protein
MIGYLYLLIEVNEKGEEHHKIGISKNNPEIRAKKLQTGNSNKIDVLRIYESKNYKSIEKWLHSKFYNKRTLSENEWFKLSDEDVINFLDTCKKMDDTIEMLIRENSFYKEIF